jgi:hypothetical protein
MKAVKIIVGLAIAYVGIVVVFESLIGVIQPEPGGTLVITTFEADGSAHERVVSSLESDGKLYVAANHWPRAWYRNALANPEVRVEREVGSGAFRAVPVSGAEFERVNTEHALPLVFRFLTGFPPRHLLRLDPAEPAAPEAAAPEAMDGA